MKLYESLKDEVTELLQDVDADKLEDMMKELTFAQYLELAAAVADENVDKANEILNLPDGEETLDDIDTDIEVDDEDELDFGDDDERQEDFDLDLGDEGAEDVAETRSGAAPGWMLRQDPELAAKAKKTKEPYIQMSKLAQYADSDEWRTPPPDEELEEQDNPYAGLTPPSQQRLPTATGTGVEMPTVPGVDDVGDEEESSLVSKKEIDDLEPGDEVTVSDISGKSVKAKVRNPRGPADSVVVMGDGGEFVVKKDKVLDTPVIEGKQLDESASTFAAGIRMARMMFSDLIKDPPEVTKMAYDQVRAGRGLNARLTRSVSPYLFIVERILADPQLRLRFLKIARMAGPIDLTPDGQLIDDPDAVDDLDVVEPEDQVEVDDAPEVDDEPEDTRLRDDIDWLRRMAGLSETTTAGAIATAATPMGNVKKRVEKPTPKVKKEDSGTRKKKK